MFSQLSQIARVWEVCNQIGDTVSKNDNGCPICSKKTY